jgi:glycine/D-amino acid oxidase-like deaminating enzyme
MDVVIIGGGIVGTAAAAFLADAGVRVTLVEREGLASGASGANQGIVQHPFDPILDPLYHDTLGLYRDLSAPGSGFHLPDEPTGMLFVSPDEEVTRAEAAEISETFDHVRTDVIGGADLHRLEPSLAEGLWACRADIGFPVAPGASTYAYATRAESLGAVIRQGRAATVAVEGGAVVGVQAGGRLIPADAVLIAAGPWTSDLLEPLGRGVPIVPRWGVVIEADVASPPRHILEEGGIGSMLAGQEEGPEQDFSLVPFADTSAIGATFLVDEPVPEDWIERILTRAMAFVPGVEDAPIRSVRACARPMCTDGRPLIGPVPGVAGLYVCAGHGPWGISTGPASAWLVTDAILGRDPFIPPELHPARFLA